MHTGSITQSASLDRPIRGAELIIENVIEHMKYIKVYYPLAQQKYENMFHLLVQVRKAMAGEVHTK